jgi:hypothetical protein
LGRDRAEAATCRLSPRAENIRSIRACPDLTQRGSRAMSAYAPLSGA